MTPYRTSTHGRVMSALVDWDLRAVKAAPPRSSQSATFRAAGQAGRSWGVLVDRVQRFQALKPSSRAARADDDSGSLKTAGAAVACVHAPCMRRSVNDTHQQDPCAAVHEQVAEHGPGISGFDGFDGFESFESFDGCADGHLVR